MKNNNSSSPYSILSRETFAYHHGCDFTTILNLSEFPVSPNCKIFKLEHRKTIKNETNEFAIYFSDSRFPGWMFMFNCFSRPNENTYHTLGCFAHDSKFLEQSLYFPDLSITNFGQLENFLNRLFPKRTKKKKN